MEETVMTKQEHKQNHQVKTGCVILIVSDTRTKESDVSGNLAKKLLTQNGHQVLAYQIVKNDKTAIQTAVLNFLQNKNIQIILISGGTGVSKRDVTTDLMLELFEKTLVGFGEAFRRLGWEKIGESAILSRAVAGVLGSRVIFCLPGSPDAVELGLRKIILPVLGHLVWEVNR